MSDDQKSHVEWIERVQRLALLAGAVGAGAIAAYAALWAAIFLLVLIVDIVKDEANGVWAAFGFLISVSGALGFGYVARSLWRLRGAMQ